MYICSDESFILIRMKKNYIFKLILLLGISLGYLTSAMAQKDNGIHLSTFGFKSHEVKVNALSTILLQHPEISYEYSFNQDLSVGGRLGFSFNDNYEYQGVFQLMPYVRWHFYTGSSSNVHSLRGFFAEVNAGYTLYKVKKLSSSSLGSYDYDRVISSNESAFGMGIGVGYKYISLRNWVVETTLMAGRNFASPYSREIYMGLGLAIGKRF